MRLKQIQVKIFEPGNKKSLSHTYRAPQGAAFAPEAIEHLLHRLCENVEKEYPGEDYKLIAVGPSSFNFVHQGKAEEVA
jgi:hypothetical protein